MSAVSPFSNQQSQHQSNVHTNTIDINSLHNMLASLQQTSNRLNHKLTADELHKSTQTSSTGHDRTALTEQQSILTENNVDVNKGYYHYNVSTLRRRAEIAFPTIIETTLQSVEYASYSGIFPQINRIQISVDNILILWNYCKPGDYVQFTNIDEVIVSCELVKPIPNVFNKDIDYLLVAATSIDITLIGLIFTDKQKRNFGKIRLVQISSIPSDDIVMLKIRSTCDGRIFMCGKDGCLYELEYQQNKPNAFTSLFSLSSNPPSKLRKLNRSSSRLRQILSYPASLLFGPNFDTNTTGKDALQSSTQQTSLMNGLHFSSHQDSFIDLAIHTYSDTKSGLLFGLTAKSSSIHVWKYYSSVGGATEKDGVSTGQHSSSMSQLTKISKINELVNEYLNKNSRFSSINSQSQQHQVPQSSSLNLNDSSVNKALNISLVSIYVDDCMQVSSYKSSGFGFGSSLGIGTHTSIDSNLSSNIVCLVGLTKTSMRIYFQFRLDNNAFEILGVREAPPHVTPPYGDRNDWQPHFLPDSSPNSLCLSTYSKRVLLIVDRQTNCDRLIAVSRDSGSKFRKLHAQKSSIPSSQPQLQAQSQIKPQLESNSTQISNNFSFSNLPKPYSSSLTTSMNSTPLIESIESLIFDYRISDLIEIPIEFYMSKLASFQYCSSLGKKEYKALENLSEYAVQHCLSPRQFVALHGRGLTFFEKLPAISILKSLIERCDDSFPTSSLHNASIRHKSIGLLNSSTNTCSPTSSNLMDLFVQIGRSYGESEACSMCLALICCPISSSHRHRLDFSMSNESENGYMLIDEVERKENGDQSCGIIDEDGIEPENYSIQQRATFLYFEVFGGQPTSFDAAKNQQPSASFLSSQNQNGHLEPSIKISESSSSSTNAPNLSATIPFLNNQISQSSSSTNRFTPSPKLDSLFQFASRLLRPIWHWKVLVKVGYDVERLRLRFLPEDFRIILTPLISLRNFIETHSDKLCPSKISSLNLSSAADILRQANKQTLQFTSSHQHNQLFDQQGKSTREYLLKQRQALIERHRLMQIEGEQVKGLKFLLDRTIELLELLIRFSVDSNLIGQLHSMLSFDLQKYFETATFEHLIIEFKGEEVVRNLIRNAINCNTIKTDLMPYLNFDDYYGLSFNTLSNECSNEIGSSSVLRQRNRLSHFFDASDHFLTKGDEFIKKALDCKNDQDLFRGFVRDASKCYAKVLELLDSRFPLNYTAKKLSLVSDYVSIVEFSVKALKNLVSLDSNSSVDLIDFSKNSKILSCDFDEAIELLSFEKCLETCGQAFYEVYSKRDFVNKGENEDNKGQKQGTYKKEDNRLNFVEDKSKVSTVIQYDEERNRLLFKMFEKMNELLPFQASPLYKQIQTQIYEYFMKNQLYGLFSIHTQNSLQPYLESFLFEHSKTDKQAVEILLTIWQGNRSYFKAAKLARYWAIITAGEIQQTSISLSHRMDFIARSIRFMNLISNQNTEQVEFCQMLQTIKMFIQTQNELETELEILFSQNLSHDKEIKARLESDLKAIHERILPFREMYNICNQYELYEICLKLIMNSQKTNEDCFEVVGAVQEALLNRDVRKHKTNLNNNGVEQAGRVKLTLAKMMNLMNFDGKLVPLDTIIRCLETFNIRCLVNPHTDLVSSIILSLQIPCFERVLKGYSNFVNYILNINKNLSKDTDTNDLDSKIQDFKSGNFFFVLESIFSILQETLHRYSNVLKTKENSCGYSISEKIEAINLINLCIEHFPQLLPIENSNKNETHNRLLKLLKKYHNKFTSLDNNCIFNRLSQRSNLNTSEMSQDDSKIDHE